ncbi:MAG: hypothetical protein P8M11_06095 [Planctomycetota bacterium]|nr:hypothetical protein [Planctomycetota bacterium]MDG1984116.1 hypothetical protein [Planctomycetota bacterium]
MLRHWEFAVWLAAALVVGGLIAGRAFLHHWRSGGGLRTAAVGASLSLWTFGLGYLAAECWFVGVHDQSDGYAQTLAGKRWFWRHWKPINTLGYRDREHDFSGKSPLLVVGDSFVAGHGTKDIDDRMASVLQRNLGDDWEVAIIAQNGWNPVQEIEALRAFPATPARILVSYYINDIESAAMAQGNPRPKLRLRYPPEQVRWLVEKSHFANWFYWRVVRGRFGTVYWDWLKDAYDDEATLEHHGQELQGFLDYAAETGAEIAFIVWPNLDYIEDSRAYTARVTSMLTARGALAIDLGEHFRGRDERTLVVNPMDGHPNPKTQAEVINLLLDLW